MAGRPTRGSCRRFVAAWAVALCLNSESRPMGVRTVPPIPAVDPGAQAAAASGRETPDLERIFREALPSVFLVETETWMGPGVLVDASGLILTPSLDAMPGDYLAVTVAPGKKVAARVVPVPGSACGVIKVHPETVTGLSPLPLAGPPEESDFPAVEDSLVAIFWSTDSGFVRRSGTVRKVLDRSFSSDLPVPASSPPHAPSTCDSRRLHCSSGVVLDTRGRVVGLDLVRELKGKQRTTIPRIRKSGELLSAARAGAAKIPPPSPSPLPVPPAAPFPETALDRPARSVDPALYQVLARPFLVEFLTPPLSHSTAREEREGAVSDREEACSRPKGTVKRWRPDFSDRSAVVTVRVIPEIHRRAGTYAGVTAYWIFIPVVFVFAVLTHSGVMIGDPPHVSSRFEPDIREIEVLRGGRRVEPIRPRRVCAEGSSFLDIDFCPPESRASEKRRVKGCYFVSTYPAEDFVPGEAVELRIYGEEAGEAAVTVPLDDTLIQRIDADFRPYFDTTTGKKSPL